MKKKAYLTPQMEVVEIKFQPQLLAGSGIDVLNVDAGENIPGLAPDMDCMDFEFDELNPTGL